MTTTAARTAHIAAHFVRIAARNARRPASVAGAVLTASAVVLLPTLPASAATTSVTPAFTCAAANTDGSYTFFFSYTNSTSATVFIDGRARNDVTPASAGADPPTRFEAGTHAAFSVTTNKDSVKWRLDGTTAEANTSTLCTGQAVVAESWSPLLLPAAAIAPFALWFVRNRRRQRLAPAQ